MKEEEFNLSNRLRSGDCTVCSSPIGEWLSPEDVKEFIRLLKRELGIMDILDDNFSVDKFSNMTMKEAEEIIDTLAGDKLK